jgi:hypothetical protein
LHFASTENPGPGRLQPTHCELIHALKIGEATEVINGSSSVEARYQSPTLQA